MSTLLKDCRDVLSTEEIDKPKRILVKYGDISSTNDANIGKIGLIQHKINTQNKMPIAQRPRILPIAREKEVH